MSEPALMYGSLQQDHQASMPLPKYLGFPVADMRQSDMEFTVEPSFGSSMPRHCDFQPNSDAEPSYNEYKAHSNVNAPLEVTTAGMYPSSATFTPSNTQIGPQNPATTSPMETRFHAHSLGPPSPKRRYSLQSDLEPHSSVMPQAQTGRRRGSEYVEPGSARAVYLEKNRKAASKCRSKQKRQQEELVESARDIERRNKVLKAEVEILKSGIQHLMELVSQHSGCPDARLRLYFQREADRLADGVPRSSILSPFSEHPFSEPPSTDKKSSQEGS